MAPRSLQEGTVTQMRRIHAAWTDQALHFWGESLQDVSSDMARAGAWDHAEDSPLLSSEDVRSALARLNLDDVVPDASWRSSIALRIPVRNGQPLSSSHLLVPGDETSEEAAWTLADVVVPTVRSRADRVLRALGAFGRLGWQRDDTISLASSVRYFSLVADLITDLLAEQRFVPSLVQLGDSSHQAYWQPWLNDEDTRRRTNVLLRAMPPSVRAVVNEHDHAPWPILEECLRVLCDASVRSVMIQGDFVEAIADRDAELDVQVAWLGGLLDQDRDVVVGNGDSGSDVMNEARRWLARLDEPDKEAPFQLLLRLHEPEQPSHATAGDGRRSGLWRLEFALQHGTRDDLVIDGQTIWNADGARAVSFGDSMDAQEALLNELGRTAIVYEPIKQALQSEHPTECWLSTEEAYDFLKEHGPILEEMGVRVVPPDWWDTLNSRLGLRLMLHSSEAEPGISGPSGDARPVHVGLESIIEYEWKAAIGDYVLSLEEFKQLEASRAGLAPIDGRWVEVRPADLEKLRAQLEQDPRGSMSLIDSMRMAFGLNDGDRRLPVFGVEATGWVGQLLEGGLQLHTDQVRQPESLHGTLRPYQRHGLAWLSFLDRLGLGGCLADDMGLGKTIQLIALLLHEREGAGKDHAFGPTLIVAPMSVVGNWLKEFERFAPDLAVRIHHGVERPVGDAFVEDARRHDVVITTYGLISRDIETIQRVPWHRVVLDEAQNIKNPPTKQAQAVRSLRASRRVTLTGTPVENRLTELWSIMEFCNPGYLGTQHEFRQRFVMEIERKNDQQTARALRTMIQPFILRRLKTDPDVVPDLPDLVETRQHAALTREQRELYQRVLDGMMTRVREADGVQRRGYVLAGLVKLKQICNHPANMASGDDSQRPALEIDARATMPLSSGKVQRLLQMLDEVIAEGDKALVFTQFRRMGHLLEHMIRRELDTDVLFLHGGTSRKKREALIDRFQSDDSTAPVFILSLRAGGLGLNLTAANHVFHFDRWWNPAVENQATDRAFRIGQTRTVYVHRLICSGTLEERIDEMLLQKADLADRIVGSGEQWLTELSTDQLRELLSLRRTVFEGDEDEETG